MFKKIDVDCGIFHGLLMGEFEPGVDAIWKKERVPTSPLVLTNGFPSSNQPVIQPTLIEYRLHPDPVLVLLVQQ
jgi:hypothetical protein